MKLTVKMSFTLNRYLLLTACLLTAFAVWAQSPYSLAPKWYFGRQAGLDFTAGPPSVMLGGQTNATGQEATSTMCDRDGNVLFYSDSYRLYDGTHAFKQFVNGGSSSTNGSVSFPDPADPENFFYYVTANQDPGGGGDNGATLGIYYYRIQKTGVGTINVVSGPTMLATNTQVTEQLCVGTDNNGGYWVVTHQGGGSGGNQMWSWNFTASGVGAKQISSIGGTEAATMWQGTLKINKCQNKLAAIFWTGKVEVYDWNSTTGMVTALTNSYTIPGAFGYGCEFSPDGTKLYFTQQIGNQFFQMDLATNVVTTFGGSSNNVTEMGSLQLGPDDKIYVANVGNFGNPVYIGVVNDPNLSGLACNYNSAGFTLKNNAGSFYPNIYRGIANQAWINPLLNIDTLGACRIINFSYDFETYFRASVATVTNSEEWNFGDGGGFQTGLGASPTHTYAAGGTYTIQLRVTDATCGKVWTVARTIDVNGCGTPPPTCTTPITATIAPQSSITLDEVTPQTINFTSNSTFDGGNPAAQQYFWNIGTPDTTNNVLSTSATNPLTFEFNGNNGNYAQGNYSIILIIRQGLCMDTTILSFDAIYNAPTCTTAITAGISPVSPIALQQGVPITENFISTSMFDGGNPATQQYFWTIGTPDTTNNVLSTTSGNALTFENDGNNGNYPQGNYNIFLVIRQGLCMDTTSITFTATYLPPGCYKAIQADIKGQTETLLSGNNPTTLTFDGAGSIFDGAVAASQHYFWSLGTADTLTNVLSTTNAVSLSFAYQGLGGNLPEGNYTLYLTISQGYCVDTAMFTFNVTRFFIPNLITANGDGFNEKFVITNTGGRFDMEIYNRWGDRIFAEKGYTDGWEVKNVSDGIYYYSIIDAVTDERYKGWVQIIH